MNPRDIDVTSHIKYPIKAEFLTDSYINWKETTNGMRYCGGCPLNGSLNIKDIIQG